MKLLILGPQCSGKGTQAQLLAKNLGFLHFEMGKILRSIKDEVVKNSLSSGNPVPDELVRLIAWDFITKHHKENLVFEGYPRSVAQYEHLSDMLRKFGHKIDYVVNLEIPEEETIVRLGKRRTCPACGRVYILGEHCECGKKLVIREDDKPKAIKRRLEVYKTQTAPILQRAENETKIVKIDGMLGVVQIHNKIIQELGLK